MKGIGKVKSFWEIDAESEKLMCCAVRLTVQWFVSIDVVDAVNLVLVNNQVLMSPTIWHFFCFFLTVANQYFWFSFHRIPSRKKRPSTSPHPEAKKKAKYYKSFQEWLDDRSNVEVKYVPCFEEPNTLHFAICSCFGSLVPCPSFTALKEHARRSWYHKCMPQKALKIFSKSYH